MLGLLPAQPLRRSLAGMRLAELEQLLDGRPRAIEVLQWLHAGAKRAQRPRISAASWARLSRVCELPRLDVRRRAVSADGTTKFLCGFQGAEVEAVRIPARGRSTICISSQAGCSRTCGFCATATLGFGRNLRADEMMAQFMIAAEDAPSDAPASNVVFMGMGEPMDNLDEVLTAVELLTQAPAPRLRAQRVTVSTSGVLPGMVRFMRESRASLALSLNATTDAQRTQLMPQTRQWPIAALIDALRADAAGHPGRVHFVEYVLFDGLNDTDADADRLAHLLIGLDARVNLIPHNAFPGNALRSPPRSRVQLFQKRVQDLGVRCLVRWPRGAEIGAACGQLALVGAQSG